MNRPAHLGRLLAAGLLAVLAPAAVATELRGRVDMPAAYGNGGVPVAGAEVVLRWFQNGWVPLTGTYTDSFGFYYFHNLAPGPYQLGIGGRIYTIQVMPQPQQDITPILLGR
ncbi:MAG: carboxypeptidase-like regulatory domain-containing protein [Nevskia sp.]|nr:carboxypeptidase-like regulatory domain-containing protein [Nevskia sp.]